MDENYIHVDAEPAMPYYLEDGPTFSSGSDIETPDCHAQLVQVYTSPVDDYEDCPLEEPLLAISDPPAMTSKDGDVSGYPSAQAIDVLESDYRPLAEAEARPLVFESQSSLLKEGNEIRPEFLFVKVIKPHNDASLGVALRYVKSSQNDESTSSKSSGVYISRISPDGPLDQTPIAVGDQVIAINGISCMSPQGTKAGNDSRRKINAQDVANLIKATPAGEVSIIVRNAMGDPNLVSNTVPKPSAETRGRDKVGLTLRNERGSIIVKQIRTDSAFSGSLLVPGHRCIQVDHTRCDNPLVSPQDVATLMSQAQDSLTIVSRPRDTTNALVVSCDMHATWWRKIALIGVSVAASVAAAHSLGG